MSNEAFGAFEHYSFEQLWDLALLLRKKIGADSMMVLASDANCYYVGIIQYGDFYPVISDDNGKPITHPTAWRAVLDVIKYYKEEIQYRKEGLLAKKAELDEKIADLEEDITFLK